MEWSYTSGFLHFASKQDFSRLWLMSRWGLAALAIILLRAAMRAFLRRRGLWQVRTLLIGDGATAEDARQAIQSEPALGYEVVAQIDHITGPLQQAGNSWANLCAAYNADYVLVAVEGQELNNAEAAMAQLLRESIPFSVSPPLRHLPVLGMEPQYFFNHDVMLLTRNNRLEQPMPRFIKRSFDIIMSGSALLLLSPIMLIVAILVASDGGPVFYGHKRLGMDNRSFSCLKFRSMVLDSAKALEQYLAANPEARAEWQREWKLQHDPRITKIGAFLRRTSLDELPQFLNVLKGDMSLVGPRPIVMAEVEKYGRDIAHYHRVRPGITGMWQVSGRNNVSYQRRVQIDSWYVRNWSLWHDVAIICKTFPVLLKRTGY